MSFNITSASARVWVVVPALYPAGFEVNDFGADQMINIQPLDTKEDRMSADGKYHAGIIYNPQEMDFTLQPTSDAADKFGRLHAFERAAVAPFQLNMTIEYPATGKKYNCVNGILYSFHVLSPAERILGERQVTLRFENITESPL